MVKSTPRSQKKHVTETKQMGTTFCKEVVAAVASWKMFWRKMKMERKMRDLEAQFEVRVERLNKVVGEMQKKMDTGLHQDNSELKMLLTYFDGNTSLNMLDESRYVYALDLGGTNVRALRFKLGQQNQVTQVCDSVLNVVPPKLIKGTLQGLMDYLAQTVKALIVKEENPDVDKDRVLGFCFSFPVTNTAIYAGFVTAWTKDYDIKESEGKDLVQELTNALRRQELNIKVGALVNDTVGTLAIGHLNDAECLAGVIFGTGTNAAYIEDACKIYKQGFSSQESNKDKKMVINMEWGNFNPPDDILTDYDRDVDAASEDINKGKQIFEKMISGKYLGKIVGQILLKLANEAPALFGGGVSEKLEDICKNLGTDVVNKMHSDPHFAEEVFEVANLGRYEAEIVSKVCELVVKRAARLSAAAIVAILTHLGKEKLNQQQDQCQPNPTVIAIDGSLYQKYEQFRNYLKEALEDLLGEDFNSIVTLKQVKDGSGLGAAIIAAAACGS